MQPHPHAATYELMQHVAAVCCLLPAQGLGGREQVQVQLLEFLHGAVDEPPEAAAHVELGSLVFDLRKLYSVVGARLNPSKRKPCCTVVDMHCGQYPYR